MNDRYEVAPHTAACLAYDGLCEHEPRMIEMLEMAREAGIDVHEATAELHMPRTWWRDLTAFVDVAAHNVETRELQLRDDGGPRDVGCSCPACDSYEVRITGRLIDLMRLNLVLADTSWGRGREMRDAYAEFWPQLSEALGE